MKNLEALEVSLKVASSSCKKAIRSGTDLEVTSLTRACALIFGAMLEDRLMVIISSAEFPVDSERRVMGQQNILERWDQVLIEAFSIRYHINRERIPGGLPFTPGAYFAGMKSVLDDWIFPLISTRNLLAHGQWIVAFNEQRSEVNPNRTAQLHQLTLWHLQLQKNMLDHLQRLIFDLLVTKIAFERDFDKHWENLQAAQIRIASNGSAKWVEILKGRHERGRAYARSNILASHGIPNSS